MRIALKIVMDHELCAKFKKCKFFLSFVAFLGHIVSGESIQVNPKKTEVVKN